MAISGYLSRLATILRHPANRGHWLAALKRIVALRLAILRGRPIEFAFLNDTRIRCWPDTFAGRDLAYYRVPDYIQMQFMMDYLRPGDDVLDVGANVGLYTVLSASLVKATGSVDAVEAVPSTARRLLENVELNQFGDRVRVHRLAVGSDTEWVAITTGQEAVNHIVADAEDGGSTLRVRVGRLDDLAQRPNYSFGKIDIEGREWDAFRSAERLLRSRTPPVWIAEVNGSLFRYGHQVAPFVGWMAERGFDPWAYEPATKTLRRIHDRVWGDIFFVARDRLSALRDRIQGLRMVE